MKFALVTGASTGIGRAVAVELGSRGYKVGLVARSKEKLEQTQKLVPNSQVFICDLTQVSEINDLIAKIEKLDVLVNIAGIWHGDGEVYAGRDFASFDQRIILDTYSVGFTAPTLLVHGLLPKMPFGSCIVNLSGTFENGAKGWLPYFASKRALEELTIGLSQELEEKGINVNCVSPSDVATDEYLKYFPEDAIGANTPEQVATLVADVAQQSVTGKFWMIKKGIISPDGYHK